MTTTEQTNDARQRIIESLRQELASLEMTANQVRQALAAMTGEPVERVAPIGAKYYGLRINKAIALWFQERDNKPATWQEIYRAMSEGGALPGRRDPEGQVKRSLAQSVHKGSLKQQKDGKYYLPS